LKYCSKCGSGNLEFKIPADDSLKRFCCPECDSIFYTNPNLIVGALCMWEDKILLAKRNIQPRHGLWTLPAGFMENAETMREGAAREVYEETLASIELLQPYTAFSLTHISQVHFFYLANLKSLEFGPTPESQEVELFEEKDIPWKEIAFPTVTKTLEYFYQDRKSGNFDFREKDIKLF
jgi:ADP-ribose pyrophosphatase YjhB (NUDIX family)